MEHNIDLVKQIREAYAKEHGYSSFANMALNVNIVPRDITEIAKKYAEGMNAALQARCGEGEKGAAPVIEQGAVWVKAGERLPGWAQVVKWRDETGKKLPGMSPISDIVELYPTTFEDLEWWDESAGEKEDIKDGKELTAYYQKVEAAINFATWLTKNSWGRLKDEQWMSTFTKEVAPITELYQRFEKEGKQ